MVFTASGSYQSSEFVCPTSSPVASLAPLFKASYIPLSGSEIILKLFPSVCSNISLYDSATVTVLSVDAPSIIIYSILS